MCRGLTVDTIDVITNFRLSIMSLNAPCPACGRMVYPAEAKLATCGRFHPGCFKCSNGRKQMFFAI